MATTTMDNPDHLTTNPDYFPAFCDIPGEHEYNDRYYVEIGSSGAEYKKKWCLIGEITQADTFIRPRLVACDRTGASFVVALYLDKNDNASRILSKFKKGYTVAVAMALGHYFLDGSAGCRIEDAEDITVSVAPFSLDSNLWPKQAHDVMLQSG